jgi:hypothetical protein
MNFSFRRPLPAARWALALGCAAFTPCQLFAQKAAPFHVDSTWKLVVLRTMPTHAKWLHEWGTRRGCQFQQNAGPSTPLRSAQDDNFGGASAKCRSLYYAFDDGAVKRSG